MGDAAGLAIAPELDVVVTVGAVGDPMGLTVGALLAHVCLAVEVVIVGDLDGDAVTPQWLVSGDGVYTDAGLRVGGEKGKCGEQLHSCS